MKIKEVLFIIFTVCLFAFCIFVCFYALATPALAQELSTRDILDRAAENFRNAGVVKDSFRVV